METQTSAPNLQEIMHGFWNSRILLAGVEIGLFDALSAGPQTAPELIQALGADPRATEILLNALAALNILSKQDGRFALNPALGDALVTGRPGSMTSIIAHMRHMWDAWGRLDEVLRSGRPARPTQGVTDDLEEARVRVFIEGMYQVGKPSAEELARRLDLSAVARMLDVGGGPGAYAIEMARRQPRLRATIFDQPLPLGVARGYIAAAGLQDRVTAQVGDALIDNYGTDYDLVLISQLLHAYGPEDNAAIIRRGAAALKKGGLLIVNEFTLNEDKCSPREAAVFAVNMLANTDQGRTYTVAEIADWLRAAGLGEIRDEDLLDRSRLIYGRKN